MTEREAKRARLVRRQSELVRMSERTDWVPTYHETYDNTGACVSARFAGMREVPARGTAFPQMYGVQKGKRVHGSPMAPLTANITRLDLTRASARQLQQWRDAL